MKKIILLLFVISAIGKNEDGCLEHQTYDSVLNNKQNNEKFWECIKKSTLNLKNEKTKQNRLTDKIKKLLNKN